MHGGEIDSNINWIRYFGGEEQLREDLPYLLWLKRDLEKRKLDYKSFLSFVLSIREIEFTLDPVWKTAISRVNAAIVRARDAALRAENERKEQGWHPIPERHIHEVL
jgi:hypothetical protein